MQHIKLVSGPLKQRPIVQRVGLELDNAWTPVCHLLADLARARVRMVVVPDVPVSSFSECCGFMGFWGLSEI